MHKVYKKDLENIYPVCRSFIGGYVWGNMIDGLKEPVEAKRIIEKVAEESKKENLASFLPDLARLEWTRHIVSNAEEILPERGENFDVNPTLEVVHLFWKISSVFDPEDNVLVETPDAGEEWVFLWRDSDSGKVNIETALDEELFAVKMVIDGIDPEEAAIMGEVSADQIYQVLSTVAQKGILTGPVSQIRRDTTDFPLGEDTPEKYCKVDTFTLQWHITNACDLSCRHCYDRTKRSPLKLDEGIKILDDMKGFCRERHVGGHVCFSGGNPFLSKHFFDLYSDAIERGFSTSILGNPVSREDLEKLVDIARPGYFQVSLEGLKAHNDDMRGEGFFSRVIEFLEFLRDFEISSAVMLTLTKDNMSAVLPLAEKLRGHTGHFTFNRLSCVGEGADLQLPSKEEYASFLKDYVKASETNSILGFKDNLINIVLHKEESPLFDGCTGFGCGAAFNFITVLPDGEAHACRKFPSPIGNVLKQSIAGIYDSEEAAKYRKGSSACKGCSIRPVCGGCLAVASGAGLDVFSEKDPYCFMEKE